jgi:cytoskeletal protein CcmA (bactofilin family)
MGRTSLMLVVAFNLTFMMMGYRLSTATTTAYQKYSAYANIEQAGLALEGAANVAISFALLNPPPVVTDTFLCSNDPFHQGTFTIHIFRMTASDGDSIYITGSYPIAGCYTLTGQQDSLRMVTSVRVQGNAFAQYVFYSVNEQSIEWQTGEVCRGRLHTQDKLYIDGTPDFKGKVTTKGGVKIVSGTPNFEQGSSYADLSIPTDLTDLKKYGVTSAGGKFYDGLDVYVEFLSSGGVTVRTAPANTGTNASSSTTAVNVWGYTTNSTLVTSSYSGGTPAPKCTTYANVAALTSSGVLLVENGELHIKGVLDGQITLGCIDTSKIVSGNPVNSGLSSVWIDGSITYNQLPPSSQNPGNTSNDMLGIVATNNILVSQYANHDNTTTTSHGSTTNDGTELQNVTIDASLFSQTGGFGAENYSSRPSDGTLHIVGGIQQKTRNAVGQGFGANGFLKDYDWDNNLRTMQPKGYPKTPFTIQSWVDNTTIPTSFWTN